LKLTFSHEHTNVSMESEVVRLDMGIGAALKFSEATHEARAALQRILEQLSSMEAVIDLKRSQGAGRRAPVTISALNAAAIRQELRPVQACPGASYPAESRGSYYAEFQADESESARRSCRT
jgi:hypothetical protein